VNGAALQPIRIRFQKYIPEFLNSVMKLFAALGSGFPENTIFSLFSKKYLETSQKHQKIRQSQIQNFCRAQFEFAGQDLIFLRQCSLEAAVS
jgi:hypothetical protein